MTAPAIRIPLRRRGGTVVGHALIDQADAHLAEFKWYLRGGYAVRAARPEAKARPVHFLLHRVILGLVPGDGLQADHINGDRLDNRRTNLRVVTADQNRQNRRGFGKSKYRSVFWDKSRWRACCRINGRMVYLNGFTEEIEAAKAISALRAQHMPFANEEREGLAA